MDRLILLLLPEEASGSGREHPQATVYLDLYDYPHCISSHCLSSMFAFVLTSVF